MNLAEIKKHSSVNTTFDKITRRTKKNETIAEYYAQLYEDTANGLGLERDALLTRADRIATCCKLWDIDYYKFQGVKDILRTNRCEDRFCDCCGSAEAKQREEKYTPILNALSEKHSVYHVVFTVPNPEREQVQSTVSKMYKQFSYIIRLFTGNAKIKGIDFLQYGFIGAIRALEITKSKAYGNFHPHFHCMFIFAKNAGIRKNAKHVNAYSFNNPDIKRSHRKKEDYGTPERYFSDFEILLQKIWRLRMDGEKVTLKNIEALPLGYSVIADNACGRYHEVFKYATKGIFKDGEEGCINNYYDFVAMFYTLYRRHVIQGYGALRAFNFEESAAFATDERYNDVITTLRKLEEPQRIFEYIERITQNLKEEQKRNIVYISRSSINDLAEGE